MKSICAGLYYDAVGIDMVEKIAKLEPEEFPAKIVDYVR
jgi:hypothetical protein